MTITAAHLYVPPYHHHLSGSSRGRNSEESKNTQQILEQRSEYKINSQLPEAIVEHNGTNKPSSNGINEIVEQIKMLGGPEGAYALGCEKKCLESLCYIGAKAVYPLFDLNRLTIPAIWSDGEIVTRVPNFALFGLKKDSPSKSYIKFGINDDKQGFVQFTNTNGYQRAIIPYLLRSFEFFMHSNSYSESSYWEGDHCYFFSNLPKHVIKDYKEKSVRVIQYSFASMMPQEACDNIIKATGVFRQEELFLIKEVGVDGWNKKMGVMLLKNYSIVGIKGDEVFLICQK